MAHADRKRNHRAPKPRPQQERLCAEHVLEEEPDVLKRTHDVVLMGVRIEIPHSVEQVALT